MTVLPSPIPHPLDYCPWDLPGWAYEALEWVVGFQWPEGDEKETWEVADRWYALAGILAGPRDEAAEAAHQVIAGYGGAGVTVQAFKDTWSNLADGENAPLNSLMEISHELGKMIEECGCDIEGAKLEAWIELGIFVIELIGMAVAVALTLGAASPAAGGLIAATRFAIQQIFRKLIEQLGRKTIKKSLKEAGERATKQLTTKAGLKNLGKNAWREGVDEAFEEYATNGAIQMYQNSTGRRDGINVTELGMSTLGGFAGGFAASGAQIGKGGHGNSFGDMMRGAGGEVLGEFGGAAVNGQLPDLEGLAKSASSGVTGSAMHSTKADFGDALAGLRVPDASSLSGTPSGPLSSAPDPLSWSSDPLSTSSAPLSSSPADGPSPAGPSSGVSSSGGPGSVAQAAPSTSDVRYPEATSSASSSDGVSASTGHFSSPSGTASAGLVSVGQAEGSSDGDLSLSAVAPPVDAPAQVDARTDPTGMASPQTGTAPQGLTSSGTTTTAPPTATTTPAPATTAAAVTLTTTPTAATAATASAPATAAPSPASTPGIHPSIHPGVDGAGATNGRPGVAGGDTTSDRPGPGRVGTAASGPETGLTGSAVRVTPGGRAGGGLDTPQPGGEPDGRPRTERAGVLGDSGVRVRPKGLEASIAAPDVASDDRAADRSRADLDGASPVLAVAPTAGFAAPTEPEATPHVPVDPRSAYVEAIWKERAEYAERRRQDRLAWLDGQAKQLRWQARSARRSAVAARYLRFEPHAAVVHRANARTYRARAEDLTAEAQNLRNRPATMPEVHVDRDVRAWHRLNTDVGQLASGAVRDGERSMLTGTDHPPSADRTRQYGRPRGLRPPLAQHQVDLETAVPRDGYGNPVRSADPRWRYFSLVNDGGPAADPTRGINCQDCVLSFYETYVHGRPRVSAPRTFDSYTSGDPARPGDAETVGTERAELVTSGRFQSLCPDVSQDHPAAAKQQVDRAFADIAAQLKAGGPGSFAFIVNSWEGGAAHAWAAVNQGGEILFVDPQAGEVAGATVPGSVPTLYQHLGVRDDRNVVAVDALVVNGRGKVLEFGGAPDGLWHVQQKTLPPLPMPPPAPIYYGSNYQPNAVGTAPEVTSTDASPDLVAVDTEAGPDLAGARGRWSHPEPQPPPGPSPEPDPAPPPDPRPGPAPQPSPGPSPVSPRPAPIPSPRRPVDRIAEALAPRPTPVDPIAEALASKPSPELQATRPGPLPADPLTSPPPTPGPLQHFDRDASARAAYFGYMHHARRTHEELRRDDEAAHLLKTAERRHGQAVQLSEEAGTAQRDGRTLRAERYFSDARELRNDASEMEQQADQVRSGRLVPERVDVEGADWTRINHDVGDLAPGAIETDDRSRASNTDFPPPIDRSRRYGVRGGLRAPLVVHQTDLERAMPRDADGRVERRADPRDGDWFGLANDGGPEADPTRGINCLDGVLALFDTYVHGRPRVSAPRTFDSYAHGDPNRPLGAEEGGLARIEDTVCGEFQGMCPYVGGVDRTQAKEAVDTAMTNLSNHLHNLGHGAFAFIVTDSEGGLAHAWAAVNHNGTILFLDPQTRRISENVPLYRNHGVPTEANVVSMDALVVDSAGNYATLPYHQSGLWSRSSLEPMGTDSPSSDDRSPELERIEQPQGQDWGVPRLVRDGSASGNDVQPPTPAIDAPHGDGPQSVAGDASEPQEAETEAQAAERRAFEELPVEQRRALLLANRNAREGAERVLDDLTEVVAALDGFDADDEPEVVDTDHRVKTVYSIARTYADESKFDVIDIGTFLGSLKDHVRFSVQMPRSSYGPTVMRLLADLQQRGYRVDGMVNFWGGGGRHNGLNVSLRAPSGVKLEIQFPTALSRAVGHDTHAHYETLRQAKIDVEKRVEAFLTILKINKDSGINSHQPVGLDLLGDVRTVDSSFATWIRKDPTIWPLYAQKIESRGTSFEQVLDRLGLDVSDVFEPPRSEDIGAGPRIRVSGDSGVRHDGSSDEHDRAPESLRGPASGGHLERSAAGLDIRSGGSGPVPVRRSVSGTERVDRSSDGGTDSAGDSGHGSSGRGRSTGDLHRGIEGKYGQGAAEPPGVAPPSRRLASSGDLARAQRAVIDHIGPHSPGLADVVVRLLEDHVINGHGLDATEALLDPQRCAHVLLLLTELAQGVVMAGYGSNLDTFLRANPGAGPLFIPIPDDYNRTDDDEPRKRVFETAARQLELARTVGPNPDLREEMLLDDYAIRLQRRVQVAAEIEIRRLAQELAAETGTTTRVSARTKNPDELLDKVERMRRSRSGRPARPHFSVGDVIDAVGVRLTVSDMRALAAAMDKAVRRFGVGDGGRILEIENMYAAPKATQPAYRVIPMIVSIEVDGLPYTYELQLTTERASLAADIEHNTTYKPYVATDDHQKLIVRAVMEEAAALDQLETVEREDDE